MKKALLSFALAVIIGCIALCGCSSGVGEEGISLDEFNQLRVGMTQEHTEEIIGGSGTQVSESREDTDDYIIYKYIYKYNGENSGYAEIEYTLKSPKDILTKFPHREITSKTQYDLS